MEAFASLQQVAQAARRNVSRDMWDSLMGGSESETTVRRNRTAMARRRAQPTPVA